MIATIISHKGTLVSYFVNFFLIIMLCFQPLFNYAGTPENTSLAQNGAFNLNTLACARLLSGSVVIVSGVLTAIAYSDYKEQSTPFPVPGRPGVSAMPQGYSESKRCWRAWRNIFCLSTAFFAGCMVPEKNFYTYKK